MMGSKRPEDIVLLQNCWLLKNKLHLVPGPFRAISDEIEKATGSLASTKTASVEAWVAEVFITVAGFDISMLAENQGSGKKKKKKLCGDVTPAAVSFQLSSPASSACENFFLRAPQQTETGNERLPETFRENRSALFQPFNQSHAAKTSSLPLTSKQLWRACCRRFLFIPIDFVSVWTNLPANRLEFETFQRGTFWAALTVEAVNVNTRPRSDRVTVARSLSSSFEKTPRRPR